MKFLVILIMCLGLCIGLFGQSVENMDADVIDIEEIVIARDDGAGGIGDEGDSFLPTDVPVHCSILLSSTRSANVKLNLVAAKAAGLRDESKIVVVTYQTNGKQNRVNFTVSPEKNWAEGRYRIDILIDGKLTGSKEFLVAKKAARE